MILATNTMPELKKNVLNFRYSTNFKYEGMLTHSFDRFYVVTKFEMPKIENPQLTMFTFDFACKHLMSDRTFMQKYLKHCQRMVPYVRLYQKQVQYYNQTAYDMLQNEINLILPTRNEPNRKKRFLSAVLGTVASKIIGLAFEEISSFLHHKRHRALNKAIKQINERQNIEHNRIYHLEDTMIMYGKYNSDTLTNLIDTVHRMHNFTSLKERLFVGRVNECLKQQLTHHNDEHSYSITTLLFLRTINEKYVRMYERFINELKTYSKAIHILSKGYLPITLIPPSKLEAILQQVKTALAKTNKNYDLVLNRLYLYYDMKLVTFGIDQDKNLIIQFPVFVAPYMQARLTLYQIETVPVPILDMNDKAQSYMQLKIIKPYIALNDEMYILLRSQELNTCKKIGYEYFCEELFVVNSKHKFSCASAVYFNLNHEIKQKCNFEYYFNKTDITPSMLDSGQNIILANWPSYKRLICIYNNNIPVNIPSHPYVLLDRNILCNCDIEAEDNFLLESLAACGENNIQKLEMFFTVNLAFLDHLEDLTGVLDTPIDRNWMHDKQILPISLDSFEINSSLLQAPKTLKDHIKQLQEQNKKLQVNVPHHNTKSNFKGFILSFIADIIDFATALLTIIMALVVIYVVTRHSKL